jgi:hypothetical protein
LNSAVVGFTPRYPLEKRLVGPWTQSGQCGGSENCFSFIVEEKEKTYDERSL